MNRNRKYYLKQKLKDVLTVSTSQRQVIITDEILNNLDEKKQKYLFELRDHFGYNLQFTMI
jgi:recombinational DNA repair ATPase RecF